MENFREVISPEISIEALNNGDRLVVFNASHFNARYLELKRKLDVKRDEPRA